MNSVVFNSCIGLLQSLFGEANPDLVKYLRAKFAAVPDDEFKSACSKIADTFWPSSQTPFPLPAHFNEAMGLSGQNRALLAVGAVKDAASKVGPYQSVCFGDKAIHATINHFGGWSVVSNWHDKEWSFNERKFIDVYEANRAAGTGPSYLAGLQESDFELHKNALPPQRQKVFLKGIEPVMYQWKGYAELPIKKDTCLPVSEPGDFCSVGEIVNSIISSEA